MKIAELFVTLGIKGSDSAKKSLGGVKSGLEEVKSMSLEAKAGILAVMYGLQQMMEKSGQAGKDLMQFSAATGLSAEALQRWQYAGRQFNVGAEEMTGSIKSVQDAMTNMLLTGQAPAGMDIIAGTVGDFDYSKVRDTFYVMQKLQEFAQKSGASDASKTFLKGFGLSEGTIAAMRRNAFNTQAFAKANIYSGGEAENLRKIEVGWENLGDKIQKAVGHLNAKHGNQLMSDIDHLVTQVLKLTDAFIILSEKLKVFQIIGKAFEGWTMIFKGLNDATDDISKGKGIETLKNNLKDLGGGIAQMYKEANEDQKESMMKDANAHRGKDFVSNSVTPKIKPDHQEKNNNVNINQNLNFQHDGKNHKEVGRSAATGASHAVRSSSAIAGGF